MFSLTFASRIGKGEGLSVIKIQHKHELRDFATILKGTLRLSLILPLLVKIAKTANFVDDFEKDMLTWQGIANIQIQVIPSKQII